VSCSVLQCVAVPNELIQDSPVGAVEESDPFASVFVADNEGSAATTYKCGCVCVCVCVCVCMCLCERERQRERERNRKRERER